MRKLLLPALIGATLAGGCSSGGGGDGGSVQGLTLPGNLSVVTATSEGAGAQSLAKRPSALGDPGTDYVTDDSHVYVYDASMESLDTVNMILCLMQQTRASAMVNQGAYIALVNEDKCEQGENQSSTGATGQSSAGQATEFNAWTIVSTRASNDDPQIVRLWVPGEPAGSDPGDPEDAMDAQEILVEVTVNEGASDSNPYGSFVMNFKGVVDGTVLGGPPGDVDTMVGTLQTVANSEGQPQFRFVNIGGDSVPGVTGMDFGFEEAANVVLDDADGNGGVAVTEHAESFMGFDQASTYAIAFDQANLLRGKDDTGDDSPDELQCLSRTDFDTQVWRYNLYHAADGSFNGAQVSAGDRVTLNSGFPFTYSDGEGGAAYGWVGYHGVWTEDDDAVSDGATISVFDYASDASADYTMRVAPGKMIRRSTSTELLVSFQGEDFQYWGQHPTYAIDGQWRVTVNGDNEFEIVSTFEWGEDGPQMSTTIDHDNDNGATTAEVPVAATIALNDTESLWLWSDALGGNVVYVHDAAVAVVDREVTFFLEEFVSPTDTTLFPTGTTSVTLYCYERCLKGGLTQTEIDAAVSDADLFYTFTGTEFQYTLSVAGGKVQLTDDSNGGAVVSAAGLDMAELGYDWGINTGEMLTAPLGNPANPWEVYDAAVSYRWETGPNEWNQMVTLQDAVGDVVNFDRPLQMSYTHTTANDANGDASNNGKKLLLQYGGAGELWGFPWEQDDDTGRWYSSVTLKDGTQLSDGNNAFVVRGMEREQRMREDATGCGALDVSSLFSDPALALPTVADIGTVSFTLAEKPLVTDAPAVIEGEIQ